MDTCVIIDFLHNRPGVSEKFRETGRGNLFISEITEAELRFGAEKSNRPEYHNQLVDKIVDNLCVIPISETVKMFAREKARLSKQGRIIPDFDLLIGITAVFHNMILVTNNTKHFDRIEGVRLQNWVE